MNFEDLLRNAIDEAGDALDLAREETVNLVALEGARLAGASAEPGFDLVLRASRDRVALELGLDASLAARAADARIVGIIQAVLLGLATA